jgi:hypothetical protein
MLSPRIAGCPLEQLKRESFRARDLAQRDEHLADADERTRLATRVSKLTAQLEASLEHLQRRSLVSGVVDEQPPERVECGGELLPIVEGVPGLDSSLEQSPARLGVAAASGESTGCGQGTGTVRGLVSHLRDRPGQPIAALGEVAVREPEPA